MEFPVAVENFLLVIEAYPASYTMGTGIPFRGGNPARAWSWPPACI